MVRLTILMTSERDTVSLHSCLCVVLISWKRRWVFSRYKSQLKTVAWMQDTNMRVIVRKWNESTAWESKSKKKTRQLWETATLRRPGKEELEVEESTGDTMTRKEDLGGRKIREKVLLSEPTVKAWRTAQLPDTGKSHVKSVILFLVNRVPPQATF